MSVTDYYCKKCKITFEAELKAVKRPRKSCPKCHKICDIAVKNGKKDHAMSPERKIFESLDEATIEKLILDLLNEETTESRIKLAVDFHNKVKGTDVIRLEEALDMDGFLQFELSEREEEGNTSVH